MSNKIRMIKVRPVGEHCWLISDPREVPYTFEEAEDGEEFEIKVQFMTKEEIDNLPEFDGW